MDIGDFLIARADELGDPVEIARMEDVCFAWWSDLTPEERGVKWREMYAEARRWASHPELEQRWHDGEP